jgi:glycosyltransferase involved in cell wall biosynthesis
MSKRWLFLPLQSGKVWTGATILTEPLGGSEASVAYTARALAKAGEDVHVMTHAQLAQPTVYEGVKYYGAHHFPELQGQKWDIVVSSRWLEIINEVQWDSPIRVLWLHDMPWSEIITINAHRVVTVSKYLQHQWSLSDDFCAVIGDGVDMNIFDQLRNVERSENKLIWTSNPDRGTALAALIFQEVRKRWPDLEFHIYGRSAVYGWEPSAEQPFLPRREHMENVFLHDPLPRPALARVLREAWCYFYPTFWPETFCMATMEAQAAGTPVVASPLAGLEETVVGGILSYDFLNAISQLRNKRRWGKLSEEGYEWALQNTWDLRAQDWIKLAEGHYD